MVTDRWDDEGLLEELQQALRTRQAVPPEFVEAGKNAFGWHNIDAELAQLTYDSTRDADRAPSMRAEAASIRALTFASAHMTIELEVTGDSLLGQIIPIQEATIGIHDGTSVIKTVTVDAIGCFSVRPAPRGRFRLHCQAAGADVLTGWVTL